MVELPDYIADEIAIESLKFHYEIHKEEGNVELAHALKRVIEYYGGSVDE